MRMFYIHSLELGGSVEQGLSVLWIGTARRCFDLGLPRGSSISGVSIVVQAYRTSFFVKKKYHAMSSHLLFLLNESYLCWLSASSGVIIRS